MPSTQTTLLPSLEKKRGPPRLKWSAHNRFPPFSPRFFPVLPRVSPFSPFCHQNPLSPTSPILVTEQPRYPPWTSENRPTRLTYVLILGVPWGCSVTEIGDVGDRVFGDKTGKPEAKRGKTGKPRGKRGEPIVSRPFQPWGTALILETDFARG